MPQMAVTQSSMLCHRLVDQLTLHTCTVPSYLHPSGDQRDAELRPRAEGCGQEGGAGHRAGAAVGAVPRGRNTGSYSQLGQALVL